VDGLAGLDDGDRIVVDKVAAVSDGAVIRE